MMSQFYLGLFQLLGRITILFFSINNVFKYRIENEIGILIDNGYQTCAFKTIRVKNQHILVIKKKSGLKVTIKIIFPHYAFNLMIHSFLAFQV